MKTDQFLVKKKKGRRQFLPSQKDYEMEFIGNNSVNSQENLKKMISTGVDGFSIARSVISGKLDFNITNF